MCEPESPVLVKDILGLVVLQQQLYKPVYSYSTEHPSWGPVAAYLHFIYTFLVSFISWHEMILNNSILATPHKPTYPCTLQAREKEPAHGAFETQRGNRDLE